MTRSLLCIALAVCVSALSVQGQLTPSPAPAPQASSVTRVPDVVLFQMCGVDIVEDAAGYRAAHPDLCDQYLWFVTQSVSWSDYEGGTCWKKYDADVMVGLAPDHNPTTPNPGVWSSFLRGIGHKDIPFFFVQRHVGFDMPGFDIGSAPGKSIVDCAKRCGENYKCFAFTWTDYEGGTCWLKSRANFLTPMAGAVSGYVARQNSTLSLCPPLL